MKIATVILAAGQGSRMKSDVPKVLHKIGGRSLVCHVLNVAKAVKAEISVIVVSPANEGTVAKAVDPCPTVLQMTPKGTGDAVKAASAALSEFEGDVVILYGDTPFIQPETIKRMVKRRHGADQPALVMLGMRPRLPKGYGRFVADGKKGYLQRIVEEKDADNVERQIQLCNGGVMVAQSTVLWAWLNEIVPNNAKGEYYLTDLVEIARRHNRKVAFLEVEEGEVMGINDRIDLAAAENVFQQQKRNALMKNGVTMANPDSVFLCADTEIGQDCIIGPHVVFGPNVTLAAKVEIRAFCHIEGAKIGSGAVIGPFARIRSNSTIGADARIGNFVEVKNSMIDVGAKANHLSYLGDSSVGANANIGAGTITCNYDGVRKSRTEIGEGAFIGSNTALIAPVSVGAGAMIGAGSVITKDVDADALAIARAEQEQRPGWARKFREWRKK